MKKQYRSPLMASVHETAEGLYAAGVMDKRTMREFDEMCLTPVRPLKPKEIRAPSARRRQPGGFRTLSQRDDGAREPVGTRGKAPAGGFTEIALPGGESRAPGRCVIPDQSITRV